MTKYRTQIGPSAMKRCSLRMKIYYGRYSVTFELRPLAGGPKIAAPLTWPWASQVLPPPGLFGAKNYDVRGFPLSPSYQARAQVFPCQHIDWPEHSGDLRSELFLRAFKTHTHEILPTAEKCKNENPHVPVKVVNHCRTSNKLHDDAHALEF